MGYFQSTVRHSRGRQSIGLKLIIGGLFVIFILILVMRSTSVPISSIPVSHDVITEGQRIESHEAPCRGSDADSDPDSAPSSCTKLPSAVAEALIHYATSNITPQQTPRELSITARVLDARSPCNFLVFGLGYDSLFWATLNYGGRTVFLEEDEDWIAQIARKHPDLKAYHVQYSTAVTQADDLLTYARSGECRPSGQSLELETSACKLSLRNLPSEVYSTEWDAIMIDAPRGYFPEAPGRMTAIYSAGVMARNRKKEGNTDIFVHDVDRAVEEKYSKAFLCENNLVEFEGRLWHFSVPPNEGSKEDEFCSGDRGGQRDQRYIKNASTGSA